MKSIILRFRDLVTEEGGTISDHKDLIKQHGEVWWGWWMKQYESPPMDLFKEIAKVIQDIGYYEAFLFNSGLMKLYRTSIVKVIAAPMTTRIGTPDFAKSPGYYHRGSYPAWFLLSSIQDAEIEDMQAQITGYPTIDISKSQESDFEKYHNLTNSRLEDLTKLRETDVTMWSIVT